MEKSLEDYLNDIGQARTAQSVAERLIRFGRDMDAVTIHTFFGTEVCDQFGSTLPSWWIPMQSEGRKMMRQHMVQIVRRGPPVFYWGADICPHNPEATPEGLERSEETHALLGQRSTVVFPMPDLNGQFRGGGISFGFADDSRRFARRLQRDETKLALAAMAAHAQMSILRSPGPRTASPLSKRQEEVLLFLAAGYRPPAIADKLNISVSAVNAYVQLAKKKLGVRTTQHAVARAISERWITP